MALFDQEECHDILRVLGYAVPYARTYLENLAGQDFPETVIDRVGEILPQLAKIDKMLFDSLPDTMAVEVGELVLNYRQHYEILRRQARLFVREIAAIVGLPAQDDAFDKYGGGSGSGSGGGAAVSYW